MNNSSINTHTKQASKDFTNLFQKKKSIPISINSNPTPGQFIFKNNLSNIATSYKDISEKIQNIQKQKKIPQTKYSTNTHMFNNFLSVNTKYSHLSNQSTVSNKNASNFISQRNLPAKNLSTCSFSKAFLLNAFKSNRQKVAVSNRNYLQAKTENSLLSYAKENLSKNKEKNYLNAYKSRTLIKKNIKRQKSIGVLPSSGKNLKIEYGDLSNEVKNSNSNNNHCRHTTKHSKVTLSNVDEHLYKHNNIKKKISMLKYNFKNLIQVTKKNKMMVKEKTLTQSNKGIINTSNANNNRAKRRGLSHDLAYKSIRPQSTHTQINYHMKETIPKNNRTISINQININPLQSTLIDIIKEKNSNANNEPIVNKPSNQSKIPHKPIQVNVQPLSTTNKANNFNSSITKSKAITNEVSSQEIVQNKEEEEGEDTERDNIYYNENKYNMFDYLSLLDHNTNEEEEEDKFDDLNSIVRAMDFKSISLTKDNTLFNSTNDIYLKFGQKFNYIYDMTFTKAKGSERKKINMSISTQDNSYKKRLSPFHA